MKHELRVRIMEAMEGMLKIVWRIKTDCHLPDCVPCKENRDAIDALREAQADLKAEPLVEN